VPGAADFDWNVVNYAPLTVGAALIGFGGWYLISARRWFTGPVRDADVADVTDVSFLGKPGPSTIPIPRVPEPSD
jgi:hypothetical protein